MPGRNKHQDEALIAGFIEAGKVTLMPPGEARGISKVALRAFKHDKKHSGGRGRRGRARTRK